MADVSDLKNVYRRKVEDDYPERLELALEKEASLRYGENPNQPGALYRAGGPVGITLLKSGKGGLSATNLMDVTRALDILKYFDAPSVAVMKHTVPSGFATQHDAEGLKDIYAKARDADARSAFGSVVVLNREVDEETAEELLTSFVEAVVAPSFSMRAEALLGEKKSMRLLTFSGLDLLAKYEGDDASGINDVKSLPAGRVVVQKPFLTRIKEVSSLVLRPAVTGKDGVTASVEREPSTEEAKDLLTAWWVNLGVRSNGIVIVKDGVTLAVGSGQQERVGAVEQALTKAYQKAMDRQGTPYQAMRVMESVESLAKNPLAGAVLSSDGFFPFRDSIDLLAAHGITAVVQPGGSIRDKDVI